MKTRIAKSDEDKNSYVTISLLSNADTDDDDDDGSPNPADCSFGAPNENSRTHTQIQPFQFAHKMPYHFAKSTTEHHLAELDVRRSFVIYIFGYIFGVRLFGRGHSIVSHGFIVFNLRVGINTTENEKATMSTMMTTTTR